MAPHSSVLAWRIPGTGEPGGLPLMGSHRVGHDWSDLAAAAAAADLQCCVGFRYITKWICYTYILLLFGLPWWPKWYRICLQWGTPRFSPWVRKIPWRRKWQPTPGFLPGEPHGQKSLAGYSPWGLKESDTTEQLTFSLSSTPV